MPKIIHFGTIEKQLLKYYFLSLFILLQTPRYLSNISAILLAKIGQLHMKMIYWVELPILTMFLQ